ncbi:2,3-diaminopropionate biosynthesis protein SbnA [Allosaccharopolyspora coralli]|uniref:N-(2-amino-2-carboxyethyl)-L-glutamate synthase n=1 Tax=Allosaccharopolyspora coralli TaxID=2665642 RepID=A0A5Q3QBY1_9PSEU|nr:2,3-diaminopropionate biosynthesis protein SbnA [Allosaccharopolyspora coralli]QGK68307.1 2,3-diaminopropionate biosynthesis protein SbnA [Allosaccharopolyspora coralli]
MTYDSVLDCVGSTPLVRLRRCFPHPDVEVLAKLEMLNPCGSMKDRPARYIVEQGVSEGTLRPGMRLVESTSGNLGVALAVAARMHGLAFTAVVDPNTSPMNLRLLELFGADVDMVTEPDEAGGYLQTRVGRAQSHAAADSGVVWINQYANQRNWRAYYETVGAEILQQVDGAIDYLVAPVSTTGSLQGTARRLRESNPELTVVAVDAVGSVIFGTPPSKRRIPGFGASRVPEIFTADEIDDVVHVDDLGSAAGCRRLVETEGLLAGGSSGAVIAALETVVDRLSASARVVTLLPDRGERYLETVYDDSWTESVKRELIENDLSEAS